MKLLLFDIDGTLAPSMQPMGPAMRGLLQQAVDEGYTLASVGGSNVEKVRMQLGDAIGLFEYTFAENGTVAFKRGELFHENSIKAWLGPEKLTRFNRFTLRMLADLDIPLKTGTFIELRRGMLNVCPVGRNCTQEERDRFAEYDAEHRVRESLVQRWGSELSDLGLAYSIGGQISIDCFPRGWDKTYCLQFLNDYDEIYFFGDKTMPGGNDYEIARSNRITRAHTVSCPDDTMCTLQAEYLSLPHQKIRVE